MRTSARRASLVWVDPRRRVRRLCALSGIVGVTFPASAETWRGLTVASESRCTPYERARDYRYPPLGRGRDCAGSGGRLRPVHGTVLRTSTRESDIEHIVATSETHDSGLCAADRATRARFARDLENLTLASPEVNRHQKSGKDAAEWLPDRNRCWFAGRVLKAKRNYRLTVDRAEAAALERILSRCTSIAMDPVVCTGTPSSDSGSRSGSGARDEVLARFDDNRNGRITCKVARRHGIAPVHRSHPAYRYMSDGDGDGVVCE